MAPAPSLAFGLSAALDEGGEESEDELFAGYDEETMEAMLGVAPSSHKHWLTEKLPRS